MRGLFDSWQAWAALSAVFAALTAIFAKVGVAEVNSDFATLFRTVLLPRTRITPAASSVSCSPASPPAPPGSATSAP